MRKGNYCIATEKIEKTETPPGDAQWKDEWQWMRLTTWEMELR